MAAVNPYFCFFYRQPSPEDATGLTVVVSPESSRLALLEPFKPWEGTDLENLPVLIKVRKSGSWRFVFDP